ncbi:MAG: competence/damage-inducible protein A [Oscillospiraceae bacterium]|nr:competence/damage-inducible protein A [Oscillospiraceae bacterium]
MKAEIIAVGTELLMGNTQNTNATYIARKLALLGYEVHHQTVVGDVEQDIVDAVRIAVARSELTVLTGGLGPTDDDMTKEAVAKAFGFQLIRDPAILEGIRAFFKSLGREMAPNNEKQADLIQGGEALPNPNGTAPGIYIEGKKQVIAILPGPPREMEPMFDNELAPRLAKLNKLATYTASAHIFGIGESELELRIKDLLYKKNPYAAPYAKTGEVHIDICAHAPTQTEAMTLAKEYIEKIKERAGDCVYSTDGCELNETVVKLLTETGMKVSLAESCTGGLLASSITEIPGASRVFEYGMAAYADWVKNEDLDVDPAVLRRYTAISSVTAAEMAKGAFDNGRADIGVGITGLAGPDVGEYIDKPAGLVYIAVADSGNVIVKKFTFNASRGRAYVRELCVKNALDMIRRFVLGLPIDGARRFEPDRLADLDREKPKKKSSLAVERGALMVLCGLVLLGGAYVGVRSLKERFDANVYADIRSTYAETAASGDKTEVSLEALAQSNADTVGWLWNDSGSVDSVVVGWKADGYYDNHDFKGYESALGCLHIANETDILTGPDNIVIKGSSAGEGLMFAPLLSSADPAYLADNYTFSLKTEDGVTQYEVFSVCYVNTNESVGALQTFYLNSYFDDENPATDFIVEAKIRSVVNVDVSVVPSDRFLTLVTDGTDWSGEKIVVIARAVREGETAGLAATAFTKNMAPLCPDVWYSVNKSTSLVNEPIERDKWKNWVVDNERALNGESGGALTAVGNQEFGSNYDNDPTKAVQLTVIMNGTQTTGSPLYIVSRMVAAQVSSGYSDEAVKAQAIADISSLRYDFNTVGTPSVTGQVASDGIVALVTEVIDQCMFYGGAPAYAPCFVSCALKTNAYDEVYPDSAGAYPYLVSVQSSYDYNAAGYTRSTNFNESVVRSRIEGYYGIKLSDNYAGWINVTEKTAAGYAKTVSIDGQLTVTGADLALKCLELRSAYFTLTWSDDKVATFAITGNGDGVGMSQSGANQYAKVNSWSCKQILEHYFPGTTIETITW